MRDVSKHRFPGKTYSVKSGLRGDGILTSVVIVEYQGMQAFGGICLDDRTLMAWEQGLCETFGVNRYEDITGLPCHVLKSFSGWNDTIEGLECVTGRRFTLTRFVRDNWPAQARCVLDAAIIRHENDIKFHSRRILEITADLQKLPADFVDWETENSP